MKSYRKELWFEVPRRRAFLNSHSAGGAVSARKRYPRGLCLVNAMHITASVFY